MTNKERDANEILSDAALAADLRKLRTKQRKAYPLTFAERMRQSDKKRSGFIARLFA